MYVYLFVSKFCLYASHYMTRSPKQRWTLNKCSCGTRAIIPFRTKVPCTMNRLAKSFSLLLVLIAYSRSAEAKRPNCTDFVSTKLPGQCPEIEYLVNVTFDKLTGFSYRPYSTVNLTDVGCDGACVSTRISPRDELAYKVEICCRKGCGIQCGPKVGTGTLAYHPTVVSTGLYVFTDTCGRPKSLQLYVLDSDNFESYYIAYACESINNGPKQEYVFINTKEQDLSEDLIRQIFDVLNENNVDVSKIIFSPQYKDCPYAQYD